nr:serine hydrolase [Actinomadura macra]
MASKDQFSGSLLLTCRKRTVLSRSHGMADKRAGIRNGPRTRFVLASVTKLFTATGWLVDLGNCEMGTIDPIDRLARRLVLDGSTIE